MAEVECSTLTELECITSGSCTLEQSDSSKDYFCRANIDPCEAGFKQRSSTQVECENTEKCQYQSGNCYCSPDLLCRCGGGIPPNCVSKDLANQSLESDGKDSGAVR